MHSGTVFPELGSSPQTRSLWISILKQNENYYLPNFFSGSDFFLPPRPPRPPRPLPRPLPLAQSFLNGTKPFGLLVSSSYPALLPSPDTGAIRGSRYFGTCFMCGWTRVGCRGLSCLRKSRSRGLSSKWAWRAGKKKI